MHECVFYTIWPKHAKIRAQGGLLRLEDMGEGDRDRGSRTALMDTNSQLIPGKSLLTMEPIRSVPKYVPTYLLIMEPIGPVNTYPSWNPPGK